MKKAITKNLIPLLPFLVLSVLVFSGLKTFIVWSQITDYMGYSKEDKSPYTMNTLFEQRVLSKRSKLQKLGAVEFPQLVTKKDLPPLDSGEENFQGIPPKEALSQNALLYHLNRFASYLHSPRVLLVYPSIAIGETLQMSMHRIFSIQVLILLFITLFFIHKYLVNENIPVQLLGVAATLICGLAVLMNGRMIFSLLAGGIFYHIVGYLRAKSQFLNSWKEFLATSSFLLLSTVSTGVYAINYIILCSYFFWELITHRRQLKETCTLSFVITLFSPLFYLSVRKNLLYFNGGFGAVWRMLSHGYGKILTENIFLVPIILLLTISLIYFTKEKLLKLRFEYIAIFIGLSGGAFGYSTMTSSIIPIILMICLWLSKINLISNAFTNSKA